MWLALQGLLPRSPGSFLFAFTSKTKQKIAFQGPLLPGLLMSRLFYKYPGCQYPKTGPGKAPEKAGLSLIWIVGSGGEHALVWHKMCTLWYIGWP